MYLLPVTALSIEVTAQFEALKRPTLAEAVSPLPREMVADVSPALLKFESAVASPPAKAAKSNVSMSCAEAGLPKNAPTATSGAKNMRGRRKVGLIFMTVLWLGE
jgi:hypothetical protein